MNHRPPRTPGEELRPTELELLVLLCSGTDAESALARQQLEYARWGGYEFEDCE